MNGDMTRAGKKSVVAIVPGGVRNNACRLEKSAGRDRAPDPGRTFSIQLSPTGNAPVTHWAMIDWVETGRLSEFQGYRSRTVPQRTRGRFSESGLTRGNAEAAAAAISLDIEDPEDDWETQPSRHLARAIAKAGLQTRRG